MTILKAAKEILLSAETMEKEVAGERFALNELAATLATREEQLQTREATVLRREQAASQTTVMLSQSRATVKARDEELKKMQDKLDKARKEKGEAVVCMNNALATVTKLRDQVNLLTRVDAEVANVDSK